MDDIKKLPFQTIAVHKDCTEDNSKILEKIRLEINEILSSITFNQILVFGRYAASSRLLNRVFDGYLELTAIDLFNEDGIKHDFTIEGIRGGIEKKR